MSGVLPAPAPAALPGWLTFLRNVGHLAAVRPVSPPRRLLLSLPAGQLAAAAVAVGAVAGLASYRRTEPLEPPCPADVGARVSAFHTEAYRDTLLDAARQGEATVMGGTTMTTYADTIRLLPADLPERPNRKLKAGSPVLDAWATAGLAGGNAPRLHARCAATPVVVVGQQSTLDADLGTLEAVWPQCGPFLDIGIRLAGWFRHPVLVCDVRLRPPDWLASARASLVVCDGAAAWRSQLRRALPDAAHVLVTDRRSRACTELIEEVRGANPSTEPFAPAPPRGIEAWGISEVQVTTLAVADDEDLF
jgi:hypothetical protein